MSKLEDLKTKKQTQPIESITFDKIDTNKNGEISKNEFNKIQDQKNINYIDSVLAFFAILGSVATLLTLSNFIQSRKKKENVGN